MKEGVQLLYACITGKVQPADIESIDWPAFIKLAQRHKVESLLHGRLTEHQALIPRQAIAQMKSLLQANSIRALQQIGFLHELKKVLAAESIEFVLLKGLSLAPLYGSSGERHVGDLDILVESEAVMWQTVSVLHEKFEMVITNAPSSLTARQRQEYSKHIKDVELFYPAENMCIEIHSRLFEERDIWSLNTSDIWRRKKNIDIGGGTFHVLEPVDAFRYTLIHGARCRWFRLKWFMDMELFSTDAIGVSTYACIKENQEPDLRRILFLLDQLRSFLQSEQRRYSTTLDGSSRLLLTILAYIVKKEIGALDFKPNVRKYSGLYPIWLSLSRVFYLAFLAPGSTTKSVQLNRLLYSSDEHELVSLPDHLFFLYLPLRPLLYILRKMGFPRTAKN